MVSNTLVCEPLLHDTRAPLNRELSISRTNPVTVTVPGVATIFASVAAAVIVPVAKGSGLNVHPVFDGSTDSGLHKLATSCE